MAFVLDFGLSVASMCFGIFGMTMGAIVLFWICICLLLMALVISGFSSAVVHHKKFNLIITA